MTETGVERTRRLARARLAVCSSEQIMRGARLYRWWNGQKRDPDIQRWHNLKEFEQVRYVEAAAAICAPTDAMEEQWLAAARRNHPRHADDPEFMAKYALVSVATAEAYLRRVVRS